MVLAANLGFPRIGKNRELKKILEKFWKDKVSMQELMQETKNIRELNWKIQKENNIDIIPSNDFSLYDQILDMSCLLGNVPQKYTQFLKNGKVDIDGYFAMARGVQKENMDIPAMEMTKWFNTNYHYIVPELQQTQKFSIASDKIFDEYNEAKNLGIDTRPVVVGPITYLMIGKTNGDFDRLNLLDNLIDTYLNIIDKLVQIDCKAIQIDEPWLITELTTDVIEAYKKVYQVITDKFKGKIQLDLTTYFDDLDDNTELAFSLGTDSVHVDMIASTVDNAVQNINDAKIDIDKYLKARQPNQKISLGLVNGRNIWTNNLQNSISMIDKVKDKIGKDNIIIAPSCSLLHVPIDLEAETKLSEQVKKSMSFAVQKLDEVNILKTYLQNGKNTVQNQIDVNNQVIEFRKTSQDTHNSSVRQRVDQIKDADYQRKSDFQTRAKIQKDILNLPNLPTTTIGSFPQTQDVRKKRLEFKKNNISQDEYQKFLQDKTKECIKIQEEIGLDVLVHGEFERNDMVEYFGEQLEGFILTQNGWVQSYGSRCVKPPVVYGDVFRSKKMTVDWIKFAAENTDKYMKAMLTGPVTILQWSFVREDQTRKDTCTQIALAIKDEVLDLEKENIKIIQIDEAALREGLPIKKKNWTKYLDWAINAFKLSANAVKDKTQIHTHMCYSEFNDIIKYIADMDADVISIETSRSNMELLNSFVDFDYPNEIGPGVYDIHSPRVPTKNEITNLMQKAFKVIDKNRLWINPDCGLKTRGWSEVKDALKTMVESAKELRS